MASSSPARRFRIGIDVGGTFTHAVALDHDALDLAGQVKVLTTHTAREGVAAGVAQALSLLLQEGRMEPSQVLFIAHSTTQATNALLEGDVAPVGILAVGAGVEGRRARSQTEIGEIPLPSGRNLLTYHAYLDSTDLSDEGIRKMLEGLAGQGARAIVAAEPFSVDDPTREQRVMKLAVQMGLPCSGTHEVSGLYGLRVRTRTAVVNACILPKMIETAGMTERSVQEAGISAPLMVMRSDGGVMTAAEMRRRPILTILSGPAAGVAAALMYVRLSDAIFMEVGGTSTDICLIQLGQPSLRNASVGGHRLYLRTLDVHTVGVAGGSMPRIQKSRISHVGPRSAHLAGLPYCCFTPAQDLEGCCAVTLSPVAGDPNDYAVVHSPSDARFAATLTCAVNAVGRLPAEDYASGSKESAALAFAALGSHLGTTPEDAAKEMISVAAGSAAQVVNGILSEAGVRRDDIPIVGGGGGAGVLVPAVADILGLPHQIAENAPVISAIGVALALVRESVERTIPRPSPQDILALRREVEQAAVAAGASPETVEVQVEIDQQRNIVRAVATGATEMRSRDLSAQPLSTQEQAGIAAKNLRVDAGAVADLGSTGDLRAYGAEIERKSAFGLVRKRTQSVVLMDSQGIVRLKLADVDVTHTHAQNAGQVLPNILDRRTRFTDAGPALPATFLAARGRVVNLSGLLTQEQVLAMARTELERLHPEEPVLLLVGSSTA